jgi:uncharacterized membrane protein YfhO
LAISAGFLNVALGVVQHAQSLPIVYHDQNATIYENLMAFPRAFLVNHVVVVRNEEEAVLKTRDLGWGTRETVVLEEASSAQLVPAGASKPRTAAGSVEIERYSQSEVVIRVGSSRPSFLVLTDTFYPGWKAYVDGKPGTIYQAYGVVRAVFITPDSREVVFRYEPDSFRVGSAVTAMSTLIIAALYLTSALRQNSRRKDYSQ